MDAIEGRMVVTCDIPGASLQADCPKETDCYLKFEGAIVDMLCDINPEYKNYIVINKKTGTKKLYGKLTKAVYGTLLGAILFYKKLSKQLIEWSFEPNPYDQCIFNTMVIGQQVAIQFHVDELKISHVKQSVIDKIVNGRKTCARLRMFPAWYLTYDGIIGCRAHSLESTLYICTTRMTGERTEKQLPSCWRPLSLLEC